LIDELRREKDEMKRAMRKKFDDQEKTIQDLRNQVESHSTLTNKNEEKSEEDVRREIDQLILEID